MYKCSKHKLCWSVQSMTDIYSSHWLNTQPPWKVNLFNITFVMEIQTADRCNKKNSSFTQEPYVLKTIYNTTTSRDKKKAFH